jgi:2,4-dienoyl-CoA reductase-like NADH-dependent reductase (Old Yellow Enzyme family)
MAKKLDIAAVLGAPLELRSGLTIPNRIVKAAMSETIADPNGEPSTALLTLYERLGRGGAGLLITGNVMVSRDAIGEAGNVLLGDEIPLDRFRAWAEAARKNGSLCFMQLNHAGRQVPFLLNRSPVAPSAIAIEIPGFAKPRALDEEEIERILEGFARGAQVAKEAGFDGIQLHGAHGYLISQFLSPKTNQRTDRWGGDLEGRMRFLMECIRKIRSKIGDSFPIALKLNSADFLKGGITIEESMIVSRTASEEKIAFLEVSGGTYEKPAMLIREKASTAAREAHFLEYASQIRAAVSCPIMLTGGLRTPELMAKIVQKKEVDLVGLARPIAVEPDFPREILAGRTEPSLAKACTGMGLFAAASDLSWYQRQLHRMSNGVEPEPGLSRWQSLGAAAVGMLRGR